MEERLVELVAGDYRLVLEPGRGGSIARFDWRGEPLMRPTRGPSILDTACFPLVPFSNRIAHGRFRTDGLDVRLRPNFPGSDHPHPLHGFGWLAAWTVDVQDAGLVELGHRHAPDEWPWAYVAAQRFSLTGDGLVHELALTNLGDRPMPAGLGFHPYFPCTGATRLYALHWGEWQSSNDGLPIALVEAAEPVDWWRGRPVSTRSVDTVYTGRRGALAIDWPERGVSMRMEPSDELPFTVVYCPPGGDFFCAEPVSHATDAINRGTMPRLPPDESIAAAVRYSASSIAARDAPLSDPAAAR